LEHPGVVRLGDDVDVQRVLDHAPYWNPPRCAESACLHEEVFPTVREFFRLHGGHLIVYWEGNHKPENVFIGWLELGPSPYPSPRYFAEVRGMRSWADVLREADGRAWALGNEQQRERFRKAFEEYCAIFRRR
jgi:hypothetical protein